MGRRREEQACNLVRRGNRKRLRAMLDRHMELRTSDTACLVLTAIWFNRGMLRWLLEQGVSPDCRLGENGNTPLMQVAADGDLAVIKLLLAYGADVHALNDVNENALGFAVAWQQPDAIRLVVAAGADVNDTVDSEPGRTQLDCAELSNWTEGVTLLRELGGKSFSELP